MRAYADTGVPEAGRRMIAVTIGVGEGYAGMAELAAASCRSRTGLSTYVLGDDLLYKYAVSSPHWLKCHLFAEFPDAQTILYFDADTVFLKDWDPRDLAGNIGWAGVLDLGDIAAKEAPRIGLEPGGYTNTGLFVINREPHAAVLSRALELEGTLQTPFFEQSYLNLARVQLGIPLLALDRRYNWLRYERDPDAIGEAVVGHFDDPFQARGTRALFSEHLARSYDPAFPIEFPLDPANAKAYADRFLRRAAPYEECRFSGRGITICGGGVRYFACAWVAIKMLRMLGCDLPIEVWHLGRAEMDDVMAGLLGELGAEAVDGLVVRRQHPARILNGWELKPFSVLHSRFSEVISLDADNIPVVDPGFLFDTDQYRRCGAIFWPDYPREAWEPLRLSHHHPIWEICGVDYRDEPEFESGQIVVDKGRCWRELQLAMHYNEHSDFYYKHIHGDKETFHMAWRRLGTEYAMPDRPIENLGGVVMCQHGFDGRRIFQHRNLAKWNLSGRNPAVPGFHFEQECLGFLAELGERWSGSVEPARQPPPAGGRHTQVMPSPMELEERLLGGRWIYERVGYDQRPLTFEEGGKIGEGSAECERIWKCDLEKDPPELWISSLDRRTCLLFPEGTGWQGRWDNHEQMPIRLRPLCSELTKPMDGE